MRSKIALNKILKFLTQKKEIGNKVISYSSKNLLFLQRFYCGIIKISSGGKSPSVTYENFVSFRQLGATELILVI